MQRDHVESANEAFYLAFAKADFAAMDRVWAARPDVICIHPGWQALIGRQPVMESWARILGNPDQPKVAVQPVDVVDYGDAALMVCYERVEGTVMAACNLFVATADGPRLVAHQAGICMDAPARDFRIPSLNA